MLSGPVEQSVAFLLSLVAANDALQVVGLQELTGKLLSEDVGTASLEVVHLNALQLSIRF